MIGSGFVIRGEAGRARQAPVALGGGGICGRCFGNEQKMTTKKNL
jgi:hypothetical protein